MTGLTNGSCAACKEKKKKAIKAKTTSIIHGCQCFNANVPIHAKGESGPRFPSVVSKFYLSLIVICGQIWIKLFSQMILIW